MGNALTAPDGSRPYSTTERSSKPGRAFSIASTNQCPPSLFQMNDSFLYIYQEGPVGAVVNAERFPSDCGKRRLLPL